MYRSITERADFGIGEEMISESSETSNVAVANSNFDQLRLQQTSTVEGAAGVEADSRLQMNADDVADDAIEFNTNIFQFRDSVAAGQSCTTTSGEQIDGSLTLFRYLQTG